MSGEAHSLFAPAKLNLFLHITGRRADGYHTIQTLFQLLDWGDGLQLKEAEEDHLSWRGPFAYQVPTNTRLNLIHRTLNLVRQECGIDKRLHLMIDKRISVAAGLGGASSAAAALLLGLNRLWSLNMTRQELCKFALGADIPFFLHRRTALGEGSGEKLTPFATASFHYLLVCPRVPCSTRRLFADSELNRSIPEKSLVPSQLADDFWLGEEYTNAFLPLILKRYPPIRAIYSLLEEWASGCERKRVFLSGSGSTLFMVYRNKEDAKTAYQLLKDRISSDQAHIQPAQGIRRLEDF